LRDRDLRDCTYVSFADCGLPYYVGDVIVKEEKLLVATPKLFRERFNIEVRTGSQVLAIDRQRRTIEVKHLKRGGSSAKPMTPWCCPLAPKRCGLISPASSFPASMSRW